MEEKDQPAHDERDVSAEQAGVRVQFVDDNKLEVLEEPTPGLLAGEDRQVQHVGVREDLSSYAQLCSTWCRRQEGTDDVGRVADVVSVLLGRVPIECGHLSRTILSSE